MVASVWFDQAMYLQMIEKSTCVIRNPKMNNGIVNPDVYATITTSGVDFVKPPAK